MRPVREVQDGERRDVGLRLPEDFAIALPEGVGEGDYTIDIAYRGPITAPFAEGDIVARLRLVIDGEIVLEAPLAAAESVERAGPLERIANAFAGWLG